MKFTGLPLIVCLIFIAACSKWGDTVVATVNGSDITVRELRAEMDMERGKYNGALFSRKANFEEFRRQALQKLIQEKILLSEADKLKIGLTQDELKKIEALRAETLAANSGDTAISERGISPKAWFSAQKRRALITKLVEQEVIGRIPAPDDAIAAHYKKHLQEFRAPARYHAKQILTDNRETADEILMKLKTGAEFESLAKEYSQSPDGKRGGDLGYFDALTYPEVFAQICEQLKPGEISDVHATDYGFQIFKLIDKRPARQIPLEEASSKIKQAMREEKSEAAYNAWFKNLNAGAKITVDEEALKGVELEKK